jgi:hypothetical protein
MTPQVRPHKRSAVAPLWLGVHESAHAVARFALDETFPYPGPMLRSVTVKREGDRLGQAKMQFRQSPFLPRHGLPPGLAELVPDMIRNAECDVIEMLAGPAAEVRQRGGGLLAPMLWENAVVQQVLDIDDPRGGITDYHRSRLMIDWLAPTDPAAELHRLWRCAVTLIEVEFPGIVAVARALCAAGEIDGADFEAAWRECRPSETVRMRRAGKLGHLISALRSCRKAGAR